MSKGVGISHSELLAKEILDQYFKRFKRLDNVRPSWLEGLEIDRLYPTLGVAIEFQGDQHSRIVPGMHKSAEDFRRQLNLDTKKRRLIEEKGLKLYAINILDLDRFRVKNILKRMSEDGKKYANEKGYEEDVRKLQQIRWEIDPEEKLMERADSLTKIKRNYFRPPKKNWWQKLLGV